MPFRRGEQGVAPVDHPVEGLVALGAIGRGAAQGNRATLQPGQQGLRCQHPQPRRRQFERQGQAIETAADRRQRRPILGRDREVARIARVRSASRRTAGEASIAASGAPRSEGPAGGAQTRARGATGAGRGS